MMRVPYVSTHSRLKAAGPTLSDFGRLFHVSTHSRLKAAGLMKEKIMAYNNVSTHSRLKAAGPFRYASIRILLFQHTAA